MILIFIHKKHTEIAGSVTNY